MKQPKRVKRPPEQLRVVKTNLAKIIRDVNNLQIIYRAVEDLHKIAIHTLNFLKLFLLHHLHANQDQPPPVVTSALLQNIAKVIYEDNADKAQAQHAAAATHTLKAQLLAFHTTHYKPTMQPEVLNLQHLWSTLIYMCNGMKATFETNISEHYKDYLVCFLMVLYRQDHPRASKRAIKTQARSAAHLIMSMKFHKIGDMDSAHEHLRKLYPKREIAKQSLYYDLACDDGRVQDYLPCMFYMMQFVEAAGARMYNLFPLRSNIIPKHITVDSDFLRRLFDTKELGTKASLMKVGEHGFRLWAAFFKTELPCFCPLKTKDGQRNRATAWEFHHMIQTDGVSCSIVHRMKAERVTRDKPKLYKTPYVERMADRERFHSLRVVGIDPGKSDLLYCAMPMPQKKAKTMRYTQSQRKAEGKWKKFERKRTRLKNTIIEGKTVADWELELSVLNRKTVDFNRFKHYLVEKNRLNQRLLTFYADFIFRKMGWWSKINIQRSESQLINRFKETFGAPHETLVAFGDWSEKDHMRNHEPTKGKGFRKLFAKAGYDVVLVDEYKTSASCYNCHGENAKFKEVANPRPRRPNQEHYRATILCHGLLRCSACKTLWNRDRCGALNIELIAWNAVQGLDRPLYLSRHTPLGG